MQFILNQEIGVRQPSGVFDDVTILELIIIQIYGFLKSSGDFLCQIRFTHLPWAGKKNHLLGKIVYYLFS